MDWKDVVSKLAPTVATALAGPLGGAAVAALGSIFGLSDATQEQVKQVISSGQMTPEQVSEIRKLEMQYQQDEKERGFRYAELVVTDRQGAREREMAVKDSTPRNLAYLIVAAFIGMCFAVLYDTARVDSVLAGTIIGYLSAKAEQVASYYFGSSAGSQQKTDLLAKAEPVREPKQ
jgi:hypothetical protein